MANLTITLTGTRSDKTVEIEAGETIRIAVDGWLNADGTPRDMAGCSVLISVYRKQGTGYIRVLDVPQPDLAWLVIPAPITDAWTPGTYHCEVTETRAPDVNIGSFTAVVLP